MHCTKCQVQVLRQENLLQTPCSCYLSFRHTRFRVNSCILFHHCSMSRFCSSFDPRSKTGSQRQSDKKTNFETLPNTTLYYKACTQYSPVLLCTTMLAQSTPEYYFVLQSLQKARRSTTLYYKACTKHMPVLLCTTSSTRASRGWKFQI